MTIKRVEKFNDWSAAKQFYSVMISDGYYTVYDKHEDGTYSVTVYE